MYENDKHVNMRFSVGWQNFYSYQSLWDDDNISIGSDEVIMVDQSGRIPLGIMVSEITI